MDVLDLARLQFASTTLFHFLFVPLTIGLAPIVAVLHTRYVRTGEDRWRRLALFWGRILLINFAVGIVTGIVQEFQFGMGWSEYSRFVGDVFGAPLALEALLAFFLESTFLGLWIFGWDRLPPRLHLATIWIVALGTTVSAYFILAANSFMQWPVGYEIDPETNRAVMTSFSDLLTNPHLFTQFPHTIAASYATAGFVVLGVSAIQLRRRVDVDLFTVSARIGAVVALVSSIAVAAIGHAQGQVMAEQQPMKMASAEVLWESTEGAPLSIFSIGDVEARDNRIDIGIPGLYSFMATNDPGARVLGIDEIEERYDATFGEADYTPPLFTTYWSFRIMVGAGFAMIGLAGLAWWRGRRGGDLAGRERLLQLAALGIGLPYLANSAGWIFTEMGRQPWLVFGVMTTEQGLSPNLTTTNILVSLIGFTAVYGLLAAIALGLVAKKIREGAPPAEEDAHDEDDRIVVPIHAY